MPKSAKEQIIAILLTSVLFVWACGPVAAAVRIEGQVQGGGGPIASSTVTLWSASANAPSQLGQVKTDSNGHFEISVEQSPSKDSSLYLVATGGKAAADKAGEDNPAIGLMTVLGSAAPAKVTMNEFTTVASVWTHNQFLDGTAIKGHALGLRIAAGNVPNFVDLETGGWGSAIQDPLNSSQTPTMANFATLADVLAGCVTRVTADACDKLFVAATPQTGAVPTNTLNAAESIARYPWYQPGRLFALLDEFYPVPRSKWTANQNRQICGRFRSCRTSAGCPAPGCCRSSSTAAGIVRAARPCSTARATSGSATTSRSAGRGKTPCGRAMPASSPPMESRFRLSPQGLPAAGWRGAPSAQPSTPTTMLGSRVTAAIRLQCLTRTASR
jgi:hypothetical protein